jgi:hypothetical protein
VGSDFYWGNESPNIRYVGRLLHAATVLEAVSEVRCKKATQDTPEIVLWREFSAVLECFERGFKRSVLVARSRFYLELRSNSSDVRIFAVSGYPYSRPGLPTYSDFIVPLSR